MGDNGSSTSGFEPSSSGFVVHCHFQFLWCAAEALEESELPSQLFIEILGHLFYQPSVHEAFNGV